MSMNICPQCSHVPMAFVGCSCPCHPSQPTNISAPPFDAPIYGMLGGKDQEIASLRAQLRDTEFELAEARTAAKTEDSLRREAEEKLKEHLPDHCHRCEKPCKYAGQEEATGAARCVQCLLDEAREKLKKQEEKLRAAEWESCELNAQFRSMEKDYVGAHERLTRGPFQVPHGDERGRLSLDGRLSHLCGETQQKNARIAKLEALLLEYGWHRGGCPAYHSNKRSDCTCGWSEVEATLRRGEG